MNTKLEKHTLKTSILLHLSPGIIIVLVYILLVSIVEKHGMPNDFAMYITDFIGLASVELGILLYVTKRKAKTYNIKSQIPLLKHATVKEYLTFIPLMAIWALLVSALLNPIENMIKESFFSIIPAEYIMGGYNISLFTKDKLLITGIIGLIANGIVAPLFEEIYFRGYLLPRINLSPFKSVLLNAVLFSIYHFYSPWYFLSRVLMMIPLYYWVIRKKNIRFSILAHMISNMITSISFLLSVL